MPVRNTTVTASDIARIVGVSRSTVSRAFAKDAYVKPQVRAEILRVSKSLGYTPNPFARALISQESPIIGIITQTLSNPFHTYLYSQMSHLMQCSGLTPLASQISDTGDIAGALDVFRRYQVRRVVLTSFAISEAVLDACLDSGLEVFLLNRADLKSRTSAVCADLAQGGRLAAAHLAQTGRRKVALIDGLAGSWTAGARATGYIDGLGAEGLEPVARFEGDYSYAAGQRAARALLAMRDRPDAVLCANDLCAFGMMDGLRLKGGVRVPDDIAVLGYDDVPMAAWEAYDLTSVRLPVRQMVERLIDLLQRSNGSGESMIEVTYLPCQLAIRGSA